MKAGLIAQRIEHRIEREQCGNELWPRARAWNGSGNSFTAPLRTAKRLQPEAVRSWPNFNKHVDLAVV
ncbi:MAG TPA: hypothetical protein VM717_08405 [Chthoniobacterales bacterium]|nr:hypothetical protein [Chthoniobacterales bacterium]